MFQERLAAHLENPDEVYSLVHKLRADPEVTAAFAKATVAALDAYWKRRYGDSFNERNEQDAPELAADIQSALLGIAP